MGVLGGFGAAFGVASAAAAAPPPAPPIRHVYVIVLENESASTTFGPNSPAPYLSKTLRAQGAYLPNYYGIGHESNDNYIAMTSGQAPNPQNQADCQNFDDFTPGTMGANGQAVGSGCVFPASVPTIASQLSGAGFTWRDYNEDMGADPTRESTVCAHPPINQSDNTQKATATDEYATRHNPFVYFHGIIDDTTLCDTHVVNLSALPQDLRSPGGGANYSFITPDLCDDGHDAPCANGQPGGLTSADAFLKTWVPQITATKTFKQDGLLMIIFDEAATSDTSSCCGEIPGPNSPSPGIGGPGGGQTGAVLLSPCIVPGTVTQAPYNHYSMLGSVEAAFGLSKLGYAGLPGETTFGSDIYKKQCGAAAPKASARAPGLMSSRSARAQVPVSWGASTAGGTALSGFRVQVRDLAARRPSWRTLRGATTAMRLSFRGALGRTYAFRVIAANAAGQTSAPATATTVVPSGVRPARGRYTGAWRVHRVRGAWQGRAIESSARGAAFGLHYVGGTLAIIGERSPSGGVMRVTFDGRSRLVRLHATRRRTRQVLFRGPVRKSRANRVMISVVRGTVAIEGYAITARRRGAGSARVGAARVGAAP
jgi:YD repeat-containing protein